MVARLSRHDWVTLHAALLEQERKAEIEEAQAKLESVPLKNLQSRGVVVLGLVVNERSTGLYGRPTLSLTPARTDTPLPANTLTPGDIVGVRKGGVGRGVQLTSGVVTHISHSSVRIAIDEGADELDGLDDDTTLQLHKLTSDVTYRRIKAGLQILEKGESGPASHLVSVLFGEAPPRPPAPSLPPQLTRAPGKLQLFNSNLDESQEAAVMFALQRSDLAVIHGPPGTGKTTTIVEIIRQHVKLNAKVLACAPSNLAVDNIAERLAAAGGGGSGGGVKIVRIGHPARVTPLTQRHTLDALIHNNEEAGILDDIRSDIREHLNLLKKARDKGQRYRIKNEIKEFRKELRERETRMVRQVLLGADVILATLTSTGEDGPLRHLPDEHLSLTVIDECSQAIEASCYGCLLRSPKVILAGDHCQLPPTIMSAEAAQRGLAHSLMERVISEQGDEVVHMLTVQYRMHSSIMNWASTAMYQGRLTAHPTVSSHLLTDITGVDKTEDTENVLVVVDTAGCGCTELDTEEDQSKGNTGEAILAAGRVAALIAAGVPQTDIAVITPYNLQVELIRSLVRDRFPKVEVRSVDGFQGREKEAVVLSLVRSNTHGTVGFLSEDRRLNVAVTRARRHLTVICDSSTVSRHPFISDLLNHMIQHGTVRSAHEYQEELDTTEVILPEGIVWRSKEPDKQRGQKTEGKSKSKDSVKNKKSKSSQQEMEAKREENNLRRRKEYLAIVNSFLKSYEQTYEFPPNLNAYERRLIHEICEESGLQHESKGEGKERRIVLQKVKAEESEKNDEEKVTDSEKDLKEKVELRENDQGETYVGNDCQNVEETSSVGRELEDDIRRFVESNRQTHTFSPKLSSFERILVHEISEKWGLLHESQSDGNKKQVVVRKKGKCISQNWFELESDSQTLSENSGNCYNDSVVENSDVSVKRKHKRKENNKKPGNLSETTNTIDQNNKSPVENLETVYTSESQNSISHLPNNNAVNESKPQTGAIPKLRTRFVGGRYEEVKANDPSPIAAPQTRHCETCGKDVPVMNWGLHTVQCERSKNKLSQVGDKAGKVPKESKDKKSKKKNAKKGGKDKIQEEEEEDFDTLIAKFTKENNRCSQPQCGAPTTVISQLCPFCRRTFCLSHHMAEVHGCGDAARHHARTVISREGVLYPGSGVPSKKPNETRRRQLERRLDKRMEELSSQRKPKKSDKDKDKGKGKNAK